MKKNFAVPTMNYGRVVKGQYYRVLSEGIDYVKVSVQGAPFYVPLHVFDPDNLINNQDEENENG